MTDDPRTITFNQRPEDEAQFSSARLGSRVVGYLVGVPAGLCLLVAGGYNLIYAASVGGSVPEQLALCRISLALTGCVGGLPVASVLLASTYPQAARQAMSLWGLAIWVSAFSAFYFVATRQWALADAPPPGTSLAWVAAGLFDERQARAFFTLLFALADLAGSGLLLRLAVLASAESWRLGTGQARWVPSRSLLPPLPTSLPRCRRSPRRALRKSSGSGRIRAFALARDVMCKARSLTGTMSRHAVSPASSPCP
jgi:hypothetical protein